MGKEESRDLGVDWDVVIKTHGSDCTMERIIQSKGCKGGEGQGMSQLDLSAWVLSAPLPK